ncbi:hypothetical protein [Cupriavidus sp. SW-Y-13]|uniref:hypothetical protein n=1 Tax=Cupriavidus sp. SW-Y-13 TaxID=2653854 RepID=UPI001365BCAD|nr:hypothetical protein [Cupriavidus sp. SW-Y-13]MWL91115.1 hypothetical protein [Cupriavidus sp. SW-Y-13]
MTTMSLTGTGDAKSAGGQCFGKGVLEMERENESSRPGGNAGDVGWRLTASMIGAGVSFILSMFMFINGNMNEKVAPTAQAIDAGNARMARMEATSERTVKDLAQLRGTVEGLTHRVDGIDKRLDKIDHRLDRMDTHIRNEFERVHDKLDRVLESQSRRR